MIMIIAVAVTSCGHDRSKAKETITRNTGLSALTDSLEMIASECQGEVGIALITDSGDTVTVNDTDIYPLMSVFKLHQAISLCDLFDRKGVSLDTLVSISRSQLNDATWSPMLKDHVEETITVSVRELLKYALIQSDNNASNYLFETFQPVAETDTFIAGLIPRECFRLAVTEADMFADHDLCYENHSSPSGVACLLDRLVCDSIISLKSRNFLIETLGECITGTDRIVAPLQNKPGIRIAHKTGSGFRKDNGILTAHNDLAFVSLPDGRHYTLAILIKDFQGTESEASAVMARISAVVYDALTEANQL